MQRPGWRARLADPMVSAVVALGITQITAWGTSYYCLGLLAALVQIVPSRGRRAISYLTLFGAFASSVFWPVGQALNEQLGWRQTLVVFALINLAVCLPLHWVGLARRESDRSAERARGAVES